MLNRLQAERLAQGLTQTEVATRCGIHATDISRLESADSSEDVYPGHLEKVCNELGLDESVAFDQSELEVKDS